jgi:hypothetical protein
MSLTTFSLKVRKSDRLLESKEKGLLPFPKEAPMFAKCLIGLGELAAQGCESAQTNAQERHRAGGIRHSRARTSGTQRNSAREGREADEVVIASCHIQTTVRDGNGDGFIASIANIGQKAAGVEDGGGSGMTRATDQAATPICNQRLILEVRAVAKVADKERIALQLRRAGRINERLAIGFRVGRRTERIDVILRAGIVGRKGVPGGNRVESDAVVEICREGQISEIGKVVPFSRNDGAVVEVKSATAVIGVVLV